MQQTGSKTSTAGIGSNGKLDVAPRGRTPQSGPAQSDEDCPGHIQSIRAGGIRMPATRSPGGGGRILGSATTCGTQRGAAQGSVHAFCLPSSRPVFASHNNWGWAGAKAEDKQRF